MVSGVIPLVVVVVLVDYHGHSIGYLSDIV